MKTLLNLGYTGLNKELSDLGDNQSKFNKLLLTQDYLLIETIMQNNQFIMNNNQQSDLAAFATRYLLYYYNSIRTEQRPSHFIDYFRLKERFEFQLKDKQDQKFDQETFIKFISDIKDKFGINFDPEDEN